MATDTAIAFQQQSSDGAQAVQVVSFKVQRSVAYGDELRVVGSSPQFGCWKIGSGLPMAWSEGDWWTGAALLPTGGLHDFKVWLHATYCGIRAVSVLLHTMSLLPANGWQIHCQRSGLPIFCPRWDSSVMYTYAVP
jgi:hypothetical protein